MFKAEKSYWEAKLCLSTCRSSDMPAAQNEQRQNRNENVDIDVEKPGGTSQRSLGFILRTWMDFKQILYNQICIQDNINFQNISYEKGIKGMGQGSDIYQLVPSKQDKLLFKVWILNSISGVLKFTFCSSRNLYSEFVSPQAGKR